MLLKPSDEYLKRYDIVREWLVFNADDFRFDLRDDAPQEIVEMRQWLKDNDPAKDFPFED